MTRGPVSFRSISLIVLLVGVFGAGSGASAQTAPHIEIEGGVQLPGGIVPVVGPSNYPHQAPRVMTRDSALVEPVVGGRVFILKRFSLRSTYAWSRTTMVQFAYERPPQSPILSGYTSEQTMRERHRALSIVPSLHSSEDLPIRSWVGAGVAWRWFKDDETFTTIQFQSGAASTSRVTNKRTETMLVAGGGLWMPVRRMMVGASAHWNFHRTMLDTYPEIPPRSPRLVADVVIGAVF